jgi:hypothetical protein
MSKRWLRTAGVLLACLMVLGVTTSALAQGRGRGGGGGGGGGGRGMGSGGGQGIGRSTGAGGGVDRGINTSSERSDGRADRGRDNASVRSDGRADEGRNRARMASENSRRADEDLNRHPGITRGLNMSANELRDDYRAALQVNPELKFGQFVAATRLSRNLGSRYPNITREAILAGLADGRSIGQTLRNLGLNSNEAKEAERRIKREMKESMRQP